VGQGSRYSGGAGAWFGRRSLVAWALTITDLDPIKLGLLFERFLNPERVSMPDFDIDFCETRRGEVIRYVQAKYGADHVAQIITFGKLKARAVLRDTGASCR
jgi:DNA polymerase-3 subunit alpha